MGTGESRALSTAAEIAESQRRDMEVRRYADRHGGQQGLSSSARVAPTATTTAPTVIRKGPKRTEATGPKRTSTSTRPRPLTTEEIAAIQMRDMQIRHRTDQAGLETTVGALGKEGKTDTSTWRSLTTTDLESQSFSDEEPEFLRTPSQGAPHRPHSGNVRVAVNPLELFPALANRRETWSGPHIVSHASSSS